jgi:hypothetical protein
MSRQEPKREEFDREVVKTLLDSGAINFEAIGAALAKYGPHVSMIRDDDEWENFCLTMKLFVRIYRHPSSSGPGTIDLEGLRELRQLISPELSDDEESA